MSENPNSIVIIGGGHAGFSMASELRIEGYAGRITLIDQHARLPYQRPPLSKAYLNGDLPEDELAFRPASYYEKEHIDYLAGESVATIKREPKTVVTERGLTLQYDALVLATGASSIRPPFVNPELSGLIELRLKEDADRLIKAMRMANRLVVVGGGFIGLEVACAARKHDLDVDVVELQDRVMARAMGQTMSLFAQETHRGTGINIHLGEGVTSIDSENGQVKSVTLGSGRVLRTDLVVVGLGIRPRVELAEAAGLEVENGIVVNEFLETSDPAISAVGDCCSFHYPFDERRIRLESVQNATDQARNVARRLTGNREPYTDVPWFWSDQGGMKLQMAGVGNAGDREVTIGEIASGKFSVLRFDGDRLVCGESVNNAGDHVALRTLVAHGGEEEVVEEFHNGGGSAEIKQLARTLRQRV